MTAHMVPRQHIGAISCFPFYFAVFFADFFPLCKKYYKYLRCFFALQKISQIFTLSFTQHKKYRKDMRKIFQKYLRKYMRCKTYRNFWHKYLRENTRGKKTRKYLRIARKFRKKYRNFLRKYLRRYTLCTNTTDLLFEVLRITIEI